jgi:hypothetical protein
MDVPWHELLHDASPNLPGNWVPISIFFFFVTSDPVLAFPQRWMFQSNFHGQVAFGFEATVLRHYSQCIGSFGVSFNVPYCDLCVYLIDLIRLLNLDPAQPHFGFRYRTTLSWQTVSYPCMALFLASQHCWRTRHQQGDRSHGERSEFMIPATAEWVVPYSE